MDTLMNTQVKAQANTSFTPVHTGHLQRKCMSDGCDESRKLMQRKQADSSEGQPADPEACVFKEPGFGHDLSMFSIHPETRNTETFSAITGLYSGSPEKETKKQPQAKQSVWAKREICDKKCGRGATYGNVECEIDLKTGMPSGKVIREIFDKNPCTRPCVEVHEDEHVKETEPICKDVRKCLDKAGNDITKQNICLDNFESESNSKMFITECKAYGAEEKCLNERKSTSACATKDGKPRLADQAAMVDCYKNCFCALIK